MTDDRVGEAGASGARPTAELVRVLMGRQASLSLRVGAVFLLLILGVPLMNQFWPEGNRVFWLGFPASWCLLGLLFYPLTWVLSTYFVRASEHLEHEGAELVRSRLGDAASKGRER